MSGEVEKCLILHVRPKFDVFSLEINKQTCHKSSPCAQINFVMQRRIIFICMLTGTFFAILGRGPRAFQIGKISPVNH